MNYYSWGITGYQLPQIDGYNTISNCGYNVLHSIVTFTDVEFVLTSADTDSLGAFEI